MKTAKLPPHSIDAEQATLGSMMIEHSALLRGIELLNAEDFYRPAHAEIFRALSALAARNEPSDMITVKDELASRSKLDECGGTEYLVALVESVPTAANIDHYANIVKQKSTLRKIISVCTEVAGAAYNEDENVVDLFSTKALDIISEHESSDLVLIGDILHDHIALLEERYKSAHKRLFTAGVPSLDRVCGKFGEALYWVLKGRRGSGKTHWGVYQAYRCVKHGNRAVAMYSLEMNRHQVIDRVMACFSKLDSRQFRHIKSDDDWSIVVDAASNVAGVPIYICDTRKSVAQIYASCKRLKIQRVDLALVVVDYAELIKPPPGRWSREDELAEISDALGQMSKELDLTVLLLSQVNKRGEERGSEAIGNRADLLTSWVVTDTGSDNGELIVEKNRMGPDGVSIHCTIDKKCSRIAEITDEWEVF
jgi:replicative DNA helicase